jgi:Na+-transporting NADH:ubiquinone oxidoreductase subunit NqrC
MPKVYLVKEAGQLKIRDPAGHGYGLWSTMYGFIAIAGRWLRPWLA